MLIGNFYYMPVLRSPRSSVLCPQQFSLQWNYATASAPQPATGGAAPPSTLTHSCPPFQHLLSERLTSLGVMGTSGAPLKPLRDDSALRALSYYLDSAIITYYLALLLPRAPPLCRETSVSRTANVGTVGMNGLI